MTDTSAATVEDMAAILSAFDMTEDEMLDAATTLRALLEERDDLLAAVAQAKEDALWEVMTAILSIPARQGRGAGPEAWREGQRRGRQQAAEAVAALIPATPKEPKA